MKIGLILAHAELQHSKVHKACLKALHPPEHIEVRIQDLYEEYPDFYVPPAKSLQFLQDSELLIFQLNLKCGFMPPLLTEWLISLLSEPSHSKTVFKGKPYVCIASLPEPEWASVEESADIALNPLVQALSLHGAERAAAHKILTEKTQETAADIEKQAKIYWHYIKSILTGM